MTRPARRRRALPLLALAALIWATAAAPPCPAQEGNEEPAAGDEPILGAPAGFAVEGSRAGTVRAREGDRLYAAPDGRSTPIAILDFDLELEVLERRGDWVRVVFGARRGWLPAPAPASGDGATAGDLPPPATPAAGGADGATAGRAAGADPARLERARAILGHRGEPARLGAFDLYTDLDKPGLLESLDRVATSLPYAYRERYGLALGGGGGTAVALFAKESRYREYERDEEDISTLSAMGHAGYGIAALFVGGRRFESVAALLVHELAHLLNREALGSGTPAWLEEGVANDLAFSRVERSGRLVPGSLGGSSYVGEERLPTAAGSRTVTTVHLDGALASLSVLQKAERRGHLLPLATLVELPWVEFVRREGRDLRYIQSAFLVRYLLDGGDARRAARFRSYLLAVSFGANADSERLLAALDTDWDDLERGFSRWVRAHLGNP